MEKKAAARMAALLSFRRTWKKALEEVAAGFFPSERNRISPCIEKKAKDFLNFIENFVGVKISLISNGPNREDLIHR